MMRLLHLLAALAEALILPALVALLVLALLRLPVPF